MTIPNLLTQAAVEQITAHFVSWPSSGSGLQCSCGESWPLDGGLRPWGKAHRHVATEALTAAFAKLPECEEALATLTEAKIVGTFIKDAGDGHPSYRFNTDEQGAKAALVALAGMVKP